MSRFNDTEHLQRFYEYGEYPKIHDDIFFVAQTVKPKRAIDLGCCYGLLANRLSNMCDLVVGIDSNENYLTNAIKKYNVRYYKMPVKISTCGQLMNIIQENNIDTMICRRVIPELYETEGFELVDLFFNTCNQGGIKHIILEGRKSNSNAVNPLFCADKEVEAGSKWYENIYSYHNCRVLRRKQR